MVHQQVRLFSRTQNKNDSLDNAFIQVLIVAEDHRYLWHHGIDLFGIFRSVVRNFQGKLEGASTIEQQLVRTVTGCYEISFLRKIKEMLVASTLSKSFDKSEIALAYLRQAYCGVEIIGIQKLMAYYQAENFSSSYHYYAWIIAHLKYPVQGGRFDINYQLRLARMERIVTRFYKLRYWWDVLPDS